MDNTVADELNQENKLILPRSIYDNCKNQIDAKIPYSESIFKYLNLSLQTIEF